MVSRHLIWRRWGQSGLSKQLEAKKRVFWESRDAAACDGMLKQYQSHIQGRPDAGALLICVVGAKLSEGAFLKSSCHGLCIPACTSGGSLAVHRSVAAIQVVVYPDCGVVSITTGGSCNTWFSLPSPGKSVAQASCCRRFMRKVRAGINFGDGLGRCVMVLGLPYPDLRDPELKERLMHTDRLVAGGAAPGDASSGNGVKLGKAGREMYTNLCMQAVNQCVGRAIRHASDYAAVVLVDIRYTAGESGGQTIRSKLPHWVTRRWQDCPDKFAPALQGLAQFFKGMSAV